MGLRIEPGKRHFSIIGEDIAPQREKNCARRLRHVVKCLCSYIRATIAVSKKKTGKAVKSYCIHLAQRPQNGRFATIWMTVWLGTNSTYIFVLFRLFRRHDESHAASIDKGEQASYQKLSSSTINKESDDDGLDR